MSKFEWFEALGKDSRAVAKLISDKIDVNVLDGDGWNCFHYVFDHSACSEKEPFRQWDPLSLIDLLINCGADVNHVNNGQSPVVLLLQEQITWHATDSISKSMSLDTHKHLVVRSLHKLVNAGASVNCQSTEDAAPLGVVLQQFGNIDRSKSDESLISAFQLATQCAEILLQSGANPNISVDASYSDCMQHHYQVLMEMLEYQPSLAVAEKIAQLLNLLFNYGAENSFYDDGCSPLDYFCMNPAVMYPVVKVMLSVMDHSHYLKTVFVLPDSWSMLPSTQQIESEQQCGCRRAEEIRYTMETLCESLTMYKKTHKKDLLVECGLKTCFSSPVRSLKSLCRRVVWLSLAPPRHATVNKLYTVSESLREYIVNLHEL